MFAKIMQAWELGEYCGTKPQMNGDYVEFYVTTDDGEDLVRIYVK